MADGQWGTLTFEVPDFMKDARDSINSVAEFLVTALDIALIALKLAKAFLIGLIDPIAALVNSLVNEIEGLLRDLQQLGIYITGDWKLLKWPFDELKGGFSEYERRMIARLTDQTDPTRPDLPQTLSALSIFFYLSVDISDIQRLIAFIIELIRFFNQSFNPPGGMPVPAISDVKYGSDAANILQPMSIPAFFNTDMGSSPPNVAQVKWKLPVPSQKNTMNPFPPVPPGGFLVTVSTIPTGIKLAYDRAIPNSGKVEGVNGKSQPRDYGTVKDSQGRPIVLYGGADSFSLHQKLWYNRSISNGKVKDGYARLYGTLPNGAVVPLELLNSSSKGAARPFFQKTFLVPLAAVATQWATAEYMITLKADEMPVTGKLVVGADGTISIEDEQETSTFSVRVASTTTDIGNGTTSYKYDFLSGDLLSKIASPPTPVQTGMFTGSVSDASVFSQPRTITFPSTFAKQYLEAVQVALVVLFLSRPDLVPYDQFEPFLTDEQKKAVESKKFLLSKVALQRCGLESVQHLTGFLYRDYSSFVEKKGVNLIKGFRLDLLSQVQRVAHDIYSKTGPIPAAEEAIVKQTELLRTVTWGEIFKEVHPDIYKFLPAFDDITILSSLQNSNQDSGLILNPYCAPFTEATWNETLNKAGAVQDRDPQMMEVQVGSGDPSFTPVLSVPKENAKAFMKALSPGLLPIYEKYVQKDGSIRVAEGDTESIERLSKPIPYEGSADISPMFVVNYKALSATDWSPTSHAATFYCRGLFAKYKDGQILREAAITLSVAGSALRRSPEDGEWITVRFFDQFPSWQEFLAQLINWVKAVQNSLQSVVDTIIKYIEFVEARIMEIQQLIQRINALLQSMLGNVFKIPKCSALFLVSNGTQGILTDLVTAENKPNDSPLAFGAGICVVIPFGPAFVMDIIRATFVSESGSPPFAGMMGSDTLPFPPTVGIEGLPAPVTPPDTGPDVL